MTLMLSVVSLSWRAFAELGRKEVAYVKPIVPSYPPRFAIYAANGTRLAVVEDQQVAAAMIRQNDLEPISVH